MQAINDNGFISGYWYDASGERVVKTSGDDEGIYVNDVFSGGRTETANFTAYINPYLVVSKGGQYTKHIYIGSQRIVSKLGDLDSYGQDPRRVAYAGSEVDGAKVDYKTKYKQSQQTIKDRYAYFEVPYYGKDNDDYVNGGGFCCNDVPTTRSFDPSKNDNPELYQFYYHSDHLGSSSLITNLDGEIVQHIEYVPFGEVFIEERNNKWNTPFLFNAKELDEETGLYYYGARYYDPRTSIWISTDPLQEKYPNISSYAYCALNPVKYIDPDGKDIIISLSGGASTYNYRGGQLYAERMNPRTGRMEESNYIPSAGSFLEGVLNGLNDLKANSTTGSELVSFFESSRANVEITANQSITGTRGNAVELDAQGRPVVYMKNDLTGSNMPTLNGIETSPFWLDLGHELAHAVDHYFRGPIASNKMDGLFFSEFLYVGYNAQGGLTSNTYSNVLQRTEIYATFMENKMRSESRLSLRTHYYTITSGNDTRGIGPSLLNADNSSAFSNTTYLPKHSLIPEN
ncbi:RHS repeat-associated protein [Dysgonomonas alginatilytica]|uniref:RHS repeat-associated protein n=1 Tax=Dysgonomonas alginatilytica TaxID=1605892 RepID=A0A2V3PNT0_9BACT|nr:RHS repeat-associated protein [Dysgonomonas alginatilytica]